MGWADKAHQKHKMRKLLDQILKEPEYQEERRKWEQQAMLQGYVNFILIACDFLELKHGYKKNGLKRFIDFATERMGYVTTNENYFIEMLEYYKEEHNLDIMDEMDMTLLEASAVL